MGSVRAKCHVVQENAICFRPSRVYVHNQIISSCWWSVIEFIVLFQQIAEEILEGLLEEDDEVVQVWYMMGLVNVYRKKEEAKPPARFYLNSAKRVSVIIVKK